MSIDDAIQKLTDALNANTEALKAVAAAGGAAAHAAAPAEKKTRAKAETKVEEKPAGPKHTQAEVNAALIKLKDDFGLPKAKEVITACGYAKMDEIKEADFDKVYDAAVAKHEELTAESEGGGGDL